MFLSKILSKIFPKGMMKTNEQNHQKLLLAEYKQGRMLQVDNEKDNKEYFKEISAKCEGS